VTSLKELALLFLKLGTIGFGGPAAHIALMRDEVVTKRKWLTEEEFLDYLGAANLIPGPNSTELAIHIGHRRRGFAGLLVAGSCFILPAMMIVWVIAWVYQKYGTLPEVSGILYGIKPVIIAVVLQAIWGLAKSSVKNIPLAAIATFALLLSIAGINEIFVLIIAGILGILSLHIRNKAPLVLLPVMILSYTLRALAATEGEGSALASLHRLFWGFVKIGSVLYGSGYVLLAFIRAEFVERLHWLTEAQLLDAISVGQFTPGPVFTTATFIGYVMAGPAGALLATVGIFLPAFLFVALSAPLIPRLRQSKAAGGFLDGVNVASLALMVLVTWQLGHATLVDWKTFLISAVACVLLIRYKVNSAWLILAGGALGALGLGI
jgi:chromate transporter